MLIGFNEEGIDNSRKVLYRNFHRIGDQVFLVEISRSTMKIFILLFPNFETPEVYQQCVMAEKQAQRLMSESGNLFENFIHRFYLKYEKLQIEGFHGISQAMNRMHKSVSPSKRMAGLFGINKSKVRGMG
jgi:hypothetical protein